MNIMFVLFYLRHEILGNIVLRDNISLKIPEYTSFLIRSISEKDSTRNHDVVLIRIEGHDNNELFDNILSEILKENSVNSVFVHKGKSPIKEYRVHSASIFIIVTNLYNKVINFEVFYSIY